MPPKKNVELKGKKGGKTTHFDPETSSRLGPALTALQGSGAPGGSRGGGGLDMAAMMAMLGGGGGGGFPGLGGGGGDDDYDEPKTDAVFDDDFGEDEEQRDRVRAAFRRASKEFKTENSAGITMFQPVNQEWLERQENFRQRLVQADKMSEEKKADEKLDPTQLPDCPQMEWKIVETFRSGPGSAIKQGIIAMIVYEGTMYAEKKEPNSGKFNGNSAADLFKERKSLGPKKKVGSIRCHLIKTHQCGAVAKILDEHSEELHNVGCFYHKVSDMGMSDSKLPPSKWIDYCSSNPEYGDCEWGNSEILYINDFEVEEQFQGTGAGLFMLSEAHNTLQGPSGVTYVKIDPFSKMDDGTMESCKGIGEGIENTAQSSTKFIDATTARLKKIFSYYKKIGFRLYGDPSGKGGLFLTHWLGYNQMPGHRVNVFWYLDVDYNLTIGGGRSSEETGVNDDGDCGGSSIREAPPPSTNTVTKRVRKSKASAAEKKVRNTTKSKAAAAQSVGDGNSIPEVD